MFEEENVQEEERFTLIKVDKSSPQKIHVNHPKYKGVVTIKNMSLYDVLALNRKRSDMVSTNAHASDLLYAEWVIWTHHALEFPSDWPEELPAIGTSILVKELYQAIQDFLG